MRRIILALICACLFIPLANADYGYNIFNSSCSMDGTGGGGRNGFVLGNIGYGGCWQNDPTTGIIFTPCNPGNTYKYAKTWADSSILFTPIYQGNSVVDDPAWRCYDWIGVDTNVIETTTGDLIPGRRCDPNNVSTFKKGQLKYNTDCLFAGGGLVHNASDVCMGTLTCGDIKDPGSCYAYGLVCDWVGPLIPYVGSCQNKSGASCASIPTGVCRAYPRCSLSNVSWAVVDCNSSDLNASSPEARLRCAPIDCEPLMISSTLVSSFNINGQQTRDYFCRDYMVYVKPMSSSRKVKDDNRGDVWNVQTLDNYYTDVNPGLYTFAYNQYTADWVTNITSLFGLIGIQSSVLLLTPTNINYELSALCINGNDSVGKPYTYDTFVGASNFNSPAKMIGDWYPLHVDMPPNTPVWSNKTGILENIMSISGNQISLSWDTSTATTTDQNICINKASFYNQMAETPALFIKNPGKALQNLIPDWLKDIINLFAFIIDLALCGVIIWFVMRVIKAFLELRLYLYQRKIFLVLTPLIAYITWSLASLISFKIILENELAFKSTMIFAGIHSLFGVGTNNIIETAIVGAASVILGMLPAYFYKVALILASVLILMTMLVLLYDAWFVYLKPLAYPKYKMNQ